MMMEAYYGRRKLNLRLIGAVFGVSASTAREGIRSAERLIDYAESDEGAE
jgi:hypothetical protein